MPLLRQFSTTYIRSKSIIVASIIVAVLSLMPCFAHLFIIRVSIRALIYAIFAMSWDLLYGYAGLISFGHALFFGLGAYTCAILNTLFDLPPWGCILIAPCISTLAGLIISIPCLRLKEAYLALGTLAFAEIVRYLAIHFRELTGAEEGIRGIQVFSENILFNYYLYLIITLVCTTMLLLVVKSSFGLKLIAIREDEELSKACGINTSKYKISAFLLSSFIAGMSGGLYAHFTGIVEASIFSSTVSFMAVSMTIIGGLGTIIGPIVGSYLITFISEILRATLDIRLLVYSLTLVLVLLFIPEGIIARVRRLYRVGREK